MVERAICKPKAKQIKICTGAELRKMCPPNVCPCEPVKSRSSFGILRFLGFGLKSAVAAAAIYITYDMGIWGTTDDTQELYNTACHLFGTPKPKKNTKWDPPSCEAESELFAVLTKIDTIPQKMAMGELESGFRGYINNKPSFNPYSQCDQPPLRAEDTYLKFKKLWNGAIITVFHGIANFPNNIMEKVGKGGSGVSGEQHAACVPYSQLNPEDREKINNQYK